MFYCVLGSSFSADEDSFLFFSFDCVPWSCYELIARKQIQELTVMDKTKRICKRSHTQPGRECTIFYMVWLKSKSMELTKKPLNEVCLLECSATY